MSHPASYLLFYPPVILAIMLVLEICKQDQPSKIVKRALTNAGLLTAVFVGGSILVYFVNKYL